MDGRRFLLVLKWKEKKHPRAPRPRWRRPVLFSDKFQQSKVYVLKVPQIQFIDDFWTFLLCSRERCVVPWCRKTVVVPQLQFIACRRLLLRAAEADPHGPDCSADHRDSPVAVCCQVVDVPIGDAYVQKTVEIPQLQFSKIVDTPIVTQTLIPMVLVTMAIPQLLLYKVVNAQLCRSSKSLSWRRGCFLWSCRPWTFPSLSSTR